MGEITAFFRIADARIREEDHLSRAPRNRTWSELLAFPHHPPSRGRIRKAEYLCPPPAPCDNIPEPVTTRCRLPECLSNGCVHWPAEKRLYSPSNSLPLI